MRSTTSWIAQESAAAALARAMGVLVLLAAACGQPEAAAEDATADASEAACPTTTPICAGAPMPSWQLTDSNPGSAGHGETYGLERFHGKATLVALLASW